MALELSSEQKFEQWLDAAVVGSLAPAADDFAQLVESLPGVYPGEVMASLRRIEAVGTQRGTASLIDSSSQSCWISEPHGLNLVLPLPHPLDFEWRFSSQAVLTIGQAIREAGVRDLCLIATPTLALTQTPVFGTIEATYIGADTHQYANVGWPAHIANVVQLDLLRRHTPSPTFDAVVIDPPWYEEHVLRFLFFAESKLRLGGRMFIAMPARGTRPGIEEETCRVLNWCSSLGLDLIEIRAGQIPYETPFFERNALFASGIRNVPSTWRRGDLWILKKSRPSVAIWPGDAPKSTWAEFVHGRLRMRVDRRTSGSEASPLLRSIVHGDILSSVSRRDSRRQFANVWTAGNRVFRCENPEELLRILSDWKTGSRTATSGSLAHTHVICQIEKISRIEGNEFEHPNTQRTVEVA